MPVTRAKSLQRSIIISSVVGIFGVGTIVAVVSLFPLYQHFKKEKSRT